MAASRAGANNAKVPLYKYLRMVYELKHKEFRLPVPMMNILNGGRHADNELTVQEFLIIPRHKLMS